MLLADRVKDNEETWDRCIVRESSDKNGEAVCSEDEDRLYYVDELEGWDETKWSKVLSYGLAEVTSCYRSQYNVETDSFLDFNFLEMNTFFPMLALFFASFDIIIFLQMVNKYSHNVH